MALLVCGIRAPFVHIGTDITAGALYQGYSFAEQTPGELFAIGAPTSRFVVPLFSLCNLRFVAFGIGVWLAAGSNRLIHLLAVLITANGLARLALRQFPMHMRGATPTCTDEMHLILAVNPFVLVSMIFAVAVGRIELTAHRCSTVKIGRTISF